MSECAYTEDEVTGLLELIKEDWVAHEKDATNPHVKRVYRAGSLVFEGTKQECEAFAQEGDKIKDTSRKLFGKKAALKTGEMCEFLAIDKKKLEAMRKALENRLRRFAENALIAAGKDPDAYKLWIDSDSPRGRGISDPTEMMEAAGLDVSDLW
jgi:hypothetical protein